MKKLISTLMLFVLFSLPSLVNAQIYKQPDNCDEYYPGCKATVDKCRYTGSAYCVISDQIPCGEVCAIA